MISSEDYRYISCHNSYRPLFQHRAPRYFLYSLVSYELVCAAAFGDLGFRYYGEAPTRNIGYIFIAKAGLHHGQLRISSIRNMSSHQ